MMKQTSFTQKVYDIVKQIPEGKVATYKDIARMAGNGKASRAVGSAMKNNPDMKTIPCHRVVGSDGAMHGYSAGQGIRSKIELLKKEGVTMKGTAVVLTDSRWNKK